MPNLKRLFYLTHRWMGIILCLFIAIWLFSGVVMMYVGYPKLSTAERLSHLPILDAERCCISLDAAVKTAETQHPLDQVRLTSVGGSPRYIMRFDNQQYLAIDAETNQKIKHVSTQDAIRAANMYAEGKTIDYLGLVKEDAWTHSKSLEAHRPFHQLRLYDQDNSIVYVSSTTGEVISQATRVERYWNWVGTWLHWLYPLRGGIVDSYWANIVIYLSLIGTVLAITGIVVGVLRWRLSGQYKSGSKSPYRDFMQYWHHIIGLIFGVILVTWLFSGLMSMNPWKIFNNADNQLDRTSFYGSQLSPALFKTDLYRVLNKAKTQHQDIREITFNRFDGQGYYVAYNAHQQSQLIPASVEGTIVKQLPMNRLMELGAKLKPDAKLISSEVLTHYDFYYYGRAAHSMTGHIDKPLPILRIKFDDPYSTWVHLNPYTGEILNQLDQRKRVGRWLFSLLHSWDWLPLLDRRPLWDVVLVLLSIGAFIVSLTGIVIAWRRLKRPAKARQKAKAMI